MGISSDLISAWPAPSFTSSEAKIAGGIRHSIICRASGMAATGNHGSAPNWVQRTAPGQFPAILAGNALRISFSALPAEFPISVDKDSQKRVRYFFRAAHVELLTDENGLAGFGLLFADQKSRWLCLFLYIPYNSTASA